MNVIVNIERKFRPEVEGLRFVAAMLVAIYHIWFNRVSGGVDVFFVISGFLITTSIISTINKTGELKFWPYIFKLVKRLYPSVFFILSIVVILSFFFLPMSILEKTIREVIASLFYYQNWQLAISNSDYLDSSQMKSPVEHFWALSIQGQFYLIWFFIFFVMIKFAKKFNVSNLKQLINIILSFVFLISLAYSIYLTNVNQPVAYFITFTRVWEFALGGLIAINLSSIKINNIISIVIGWLGLIGLLITGILFNVSEMFPGYIALWPMICAFAIVLSGTIDTKFGVKRFLGSHLMVKLGGISFGIYLWHWVFLQFIKYNFPNSINLITGILIIVVSILLSYLMTEFIEKPIRYSSSNKYSFNKLSIMASINIILIVAILINFDSNKITESVVIDEDYPGAMAVDSNIEYPELEPYPAFADVFNDLPLAHLDGSNQNLKNSELKVGIYGSKENYDATIALIGSSHSEHWLGAVLKATEGTNYRVLSMTRSGTRFSKGYPEGDMKAEWNNHVIEYLRNADVDLVISQATAADTEKESVHQAMIDQLEFVNEEFNIKVLAVRDNPRYSFNILEELEISGEEETIKKMNSENNQKDESFWQEFVNSNETLYKMDLTRYFMYNERYDPIIGNVVIYRDNRHITNTYSESLGPVFKEKIEEILREE